MPIYDCVCEKCGKEYPDIFTKVDDKVKCEVCGEVLTRLMSSTHGINMGVGAYGYYDDNLGQYIHTNRQRREEMQRQGVSESYGKGWV